MRAHSLVPARLKKLSLRWRPPRRALLVSLVVALLAGVGAVTAVRSAYADIGPPNDTIEGYEWGTWGRDLLSGATFKTSTGTLIMQHDGHLVIYDKFGVARWGSNTNGNPGAWARFQEDGNLVIYRGGDGPALWASNTNGVAAGGSLVFMNTKLEIFTVDKNRVWSVPAG